MRELLFRRGARGSSLIEVLIAVTILALLMVGVLEMFSLSLLVNAGSSARTTMTFKCQQVVENLRFGFYLNKQGAVVPGGLGLPVSAGAVTPGTYTIPYFNGDSGGGVAGSWAYWGPAGANVMEDEYGAYKISYVLVNDVAQGVIATVSCVPTDDTSTNVTRRFFGVGTGTSAPTKRIDYVAKINP